MLEQCSFYDPSFIVLYEVSITFFRINQESNLLLSSPRDCDLPAVPEHLALMIALLKTTIMTNRIFTPSIKSQLWWRFIFFRQTNLGVSQQFQMNLSRVSLMPQLKSCQEMQTWDKNYYILISVPEIRLTESGTIFLLFLNYRVIVNDEEFYT